MLFFYSSPLALLLTSSMAMLVLEATSLIIDPGPATEDTALDTDSVELLVEGRALDLRMLRLYDVSRMEADLMGMYEGLSARFFT